MKGVQSPFKKKQLVLAVSVAMLGGSLVGCGGSSSSSSGGGSYTITAVGGDALASSSAVEAGYGGNGGRYDIESDGYLSVLSSGAANASFSSIITTPTGDTGSNPLAVTAGTTVLTPVLNGLSKADGAVTSLLELYLNSTDGVVRTALGLTANSAIDPATTSGVLFFDRSNNELYTADATATLVATGTAYTDHIGNLRVALDAASDALVTGVSVASGATLTFNATYARIGGDLINDGTITTINDANGARGSIELELNGDYIASGIIDTSGATDESSGGDVDLYAYNIYNSGAIDTSGSESGSAGDINLYANGLLKNSGNLTAEGSGTDGVAGSRHGGDISVGSAFIENTGDISTTGGAGQASLYYSPGNGGNAFLGGLFGTNNGAAITTSGGDNGYGSFGGDAGDVGLQSGYLNDYTVGSLRNGGNITASGGNAATGGAGGQGGDINMQAYGGELTSSGDLISTAGSSAGYLTNSNAYGGDIHLNADGGELSLPTGAYLDFQPGNITLSGNIDTSGGSDSAANGSGYGGNAGDIYIGLEQDAQNNYGYDIPLSNVGVTLLGYNSVDNSGGDGRYAGDAGNVELDTYETWSGDAYSYVGAGPLVNNVAITAHGGNAVVSGAQLSATGGDGGSIDFEARGVDAGGSITNSVSLSSIGGTSYNSTSNWSNEADRVALDGDAGVTNTGALTASGGDDLAADGGAAGYGGHADNIDLESDFGPVVNRGVLTANGGYGEYRGGDGGDSDVTIMGTTVTNSATITFNGGDADDTLELSIGGDGGYLAIAGFSSLSGVTTNSGTISVAGGAGTTAGEDGCVATGLVELIAGKCDGGPK